jgi:hypothetical protein
LALTACIGCGNKGTQFDPDAGDGGPIDDANGLPDGFTQGDTGTMDASGPAVIYAHTDTELYEMDPLSHFLTDIGAFDDGSGKAPVITDLAVNQAGDVWVNSENAIYKAIVPMTAGPVKITKVASIAVAMNQRFYALGFTPPGVLGAGEMLVAGDNNGELWAIDGNGATTDLGEFGPAPQGAVYGLSGDVMFYLQNGKTRGLATVRPYLNGNATVTNNDVLAEIDVAAMQTAFMTKTPGVLKKQFLGTGTMFGRLYGIGAWNDSVYAFERLGSNNFPAQLVQIGANGSAKVIQMFPNIVAGWSGAGVTTNAPVTILPPN